MIESKAWTGWGSVPPKDKVKFVDFQLKAHIFIGSDDIRFRGED